MSSTGLAGGSGSLAGFDSFVGVDGREFGVAGHRQHVAQFGTEHRNRIPLRPGVELGRPPRDRLWIIPLSFFGHAQVFGIGGRFNNHPAAVGPVSRFIEHDLPVDNDVGNTRRVLMRLFIGGVVDNSRRVEYSDIGHHARTKDSTIKNSDFRRIG